MATTNPVLLPAAPLADATDGAARTALQALLRDPQAAGMPSSVVEHVAKALLGHSVDGHPRVRGLPHRVRVPVAVPYVLTLEELRAMAAMHLRELQAETRSALPKVAAAIREAEHAATQTAAETTAAPQLSWARRPIAVPGTAWGECARRVVWQRAQERIKHQRRWVPVHVALDRQTPETGSLPAHAHGRPAATATAGAASTAQH